MIIGSVRLKADRSPRTRCTRARSIFTELTARNGRLLSPLTSVFPLLLESGACSRSTLVLVSDGQLGIATVDTLPLICIMWPT